MSYLLYPEAIEKIENSAVAGKIKEHEKDPIWHVSEDDIGCFLEWLNELKILESSSIISRIETILEDRELYKWRIWKWDNLQLPLFKEVNIYWAYEKEINRDCRMEDIMLMTWDCVFKILTFNEIRNYKNYWFNSLIEFLMTVEAYVEKQYYENWNSDKKAYRWERNGTKTMISWCIHWDFRLYQQDVKPYQTLSPYWNMVNFRPESHNIVAWSHSIEVHFLSIILKYADQIKHKLNLEEILDFSETLWSSCGSFWEFWWHNWHDKSSLKFAFFNDIQDVNSKRVISEFIIGLWENTYYNFVLENTNLVIKLNTGGIIATFTPEDIDDLIKWTIVQSARWLWRTSKERIIDTIEYRFSEEFKKDLIELNEIKSARNNKI